MNEIVVIDYGIGNVKSMINALEKVGAKATLTNDKETILNADAVILPGVGAFKHGMENLIERDLIDCINSFVVTGKPFLGVCLGMQMLMEESEEFGYTKGLGLIPGKVKKIALPENSKDKLPHVSWSQLIEPTAGRWDKTILSEFNNKTDVYFVHSFAAVPDNLNDVLANCEYGEVDFCAAVHKNNVYGTQFHPEKSGILGLKILENFIKLIK
jgi:glutamine amidotransferase